MVFNMSFSQLSSISPRKVTQLTHCTSSIEAPAASDIDFDFNQTNLEDKLRLESHGHRKS